MTYKKTIFLIPFITLIVQPCSGHNLTITCPHTTLPFTVEVAKSPQKQAKGLMYRATLQDDQGMIFVYPQPQPVMMWMKNTLLCLDMIFCDEKGAILNLHEKATPLSLATIGPIAGTAQVLEVQGGTIEKYKITKECVLKFDH